MTHTSGSSGSEKLVCGLRAFGNSGSSDHEGFKNIEAVQGKSVLLNSEL